MTTPDAERHGPPPLLHHQDSFLLPYLMYGHHDLHPQRSPALETHAATGTREDTKEDGPDTCVDVITHPKYKSDVPMSRIVPALYTLQSIHMTLL